MTILSRARHHALVFTLAAASASCAAPTPAEPLEGNRVDGFASTLSVVNDGSVVLTDVKVLTSKQDSVIIATLQPGETKGPYGISVMHTNPIVSMKALGRALLLNPVEGFDGFNAVRPAGAYTVKLRTTSDPNRIDLRITP